MHSIAYVLGLTDAAGDWYLWWSGFFGNITIFAGVGAFILHKNCHVQGCWRMGGHFGTCKKHRSSDAHQPISGLRAEAGLGV